MNCSFPSCKDFVLYDGYLELIFLAIDKFYLHWRHHVIWQSFVLNLNHL